MEPTRDRRASAAQNKRRKLQQRVGLGRMLILILLAVSLINQLLLMMKVNYHFLFSTAVPYYFNWLAIQLAGNRGVTFLKVMAVIVTLFTYGAFVWCWIQSAHDKRFLKTALTLYVIDTVLLVIFAFALLNNPFSCFLEILLHLGAMYLLFDAHRSAQILRRMKAKRRAAEPRPVEQ